MKKFLALVFLIAICIALVSCGKENINTVTISWLDSNGSLIETQDKPEGYDPAQKNLPPDTDEWHYTEWTVSKAGSVIVCTAVRVPKTKVVWKDYDGEVIEEQFIVKGSLPQEHTLPKGDEKWVYTGWEKEYSDTTQIFKAVREPQKQYFAANVFQIIVKNKSGEPISSGSGFVINNEGWFITNYHVMDGCFSAIAFFDIKDYEKGTPHTGLEIAGGAYFDKDKDIFIGKITNYKKISALYNPITFTENYTKDEIAYTFGYPNSSVKMEVNSGIIMEEYSNIYDKINGVYYILSDSYIAPGSSGGILTNENFEVIGITTIGLYADENKQIYRAGGSIPYFVFKTHIDMIENYTLTPLYLIEFK